MDDSITEDLHRDKYNWDNDCALCTFQKLFKNPVPEKTFENLYSYDKLGPSPDEIIVNLRDAIIESNIPEYLKNRLYITLTPIFSKYKSHRLLKLEKTLHDGLRYLFSLLNKNEAIYIRFTYRQGTDTLTHAAILYKSSLEKYNYVGSNDIGIETDNIIDIVQFFEKDNIYILYLLYYNGIIHLDSGIFVPLVIDVNENDPIKKFSYRLVVEPEVKISTVMPTVLVCSALPPPII